MHLGNPVQRHLPRDAYPGRHLSVALLLATLLGLPGWNPVYADNSLDTEPLLRSRVYLQISPDGSDDLAELFDTLEASVAAGEDQSEPVVIVLHGPEAYPFLRSHYLDNQTLVDRAAKLDAFGRINLRMCETWMRSNGIGPDELLPFVDPVPYAPDEVERLEQDGYLRYDDLPAPTSLL